MIDPFAGWTLFDVTQPLAPGIPVWPGDQPVLFEPVGSTAAGDTFNITSLSFSGHVGTHVDAPRHIVHEGATLDQVPLHRWYGPAQVVEIAAGITEIGVPELEAAGIASGTTRLIFKTSNTERWRPYPMPFEEDYVAVTPEGAQWIVDRGIRLVGIDYLSIELFRDQENRTHRTLLSNGVLIVENLQLREITAGHYYLICLPLNLTGADGSPARAILARPDGH